MVTRRAVFTMVVVIVFASLFGAIGLAQPASPATKVNTTLLAPGSEYVNYQGVLTDGAGTPLANGDYSVTFALYDEAEADEPVWSETQTVFTTNGLFNAPLGTATALDPDITDGRDLWLGVKVGDDEEMTPRLPISSVFYARSLVPGAYLYGNLPNSAILSIYNDTFGNNGIGLRVESRRDNAIEAEGDVEVRDGNVEVENNVEAGANVVAGQDVVAGDDVEANQDVMAGNNVAAGQDVRADGNVIAQETVSGQNLSSGNNINANGNIIAIQDVSGDDVIADNNVEAERNVFADNDVRAEGVVSAGTKVESNGDITAGRDIFAVGNIAANGTKNAVIQTPRFGRRLAYAIEGAQVWFVDQGQAQLEKGVATIDLDPIFLETVTINEEHPMLVHITLTSDSKGVYVAEKTATSFTVRELQGGTSSASFDWRVSALRKGYEDTRLEVFEDAEQTR